MDVQPNPTAPVQEKSDKPPMDIGREIYDWSQAVVGAMIFIVLLFSFFARVLGVQQESMVPTLHNNDRIVICNLFYTPKTGDIIVFTKKGFRANETDTWSDEKPLVKRVIATEGQVVQIDPEKGVVTVDGVALDEPYTNTPTNTVGDLRHPYTMEVEAGHVFVMGDNRNKSLDSRSTEVGTIDTRYILGRVLFRLFPFSQIGFVA